MTETVPEGWPDMLSRVARESPGFRAWMRDLPHADWRALPRADWSDERLGQADFSLPWCVRIRWSARNSENVDVFVSTTVGREE